MILQRFKIQVPGYAVTYTNAPTKAIGINQVLARFARIDRVPDSRIGLFISNHRDSVTATLVPELPPPSTPQKFTQLELHL